MAILAVAAHARVFLESDVRHRLPSGYSLVGAPDSDATTSFIVVLKLQNMDTLTQELYATSSPDSSKYGLHWTIDQVNELTKPTPESYAVVIKWLNAHGIQNIVIGANPELIKVSAKVAEVERLLQVRMQVFRHDQTGQAYIRSMDTYSVPVDVARHVDLVSGINRLPNNYHKDAFQALQRTAHGSSPTPVTPQSIRALYKIPELTKVQPGVVQAVVSFLGQYWAPSDLSAFQSWAGLIQNPIAHLVGYNNPSPAQSGVEASLDVDYLSGIPEYLPTWVWSTNGTIANGNEPWMVFLDDLVKALKGHTTPDFPSVFSMSYQDLEFTVSRAYAVSVCNLFQKITMTGITFVTGSGDWGVGCDAKQGASCSVFTADFPSSCPYVTSLGGTYVNSAGTEVNVDFSSGGFSNYFAAPSFQASQIASYLQQPSVRAVAQYFNASGRAFPDVATVSTNFQVVANGMLIPVAGTSAATPTFASMVSHLNNARKAAKAQNMGWINPFLYANGARAFTDITSGDHMMRGCCNGAFSAIPGWDATTGLGSPRYNILEQLALQPSLLRTSDE